jgi:glyoxylase-like metal-dependent hydrolase (beta-lactamase superfamily II)
MTKRHLLAAGVVVGLLVIRVSAQDAKSVIAAASKAMGADALTSISYYGSGANFGFGQSNNPNGPWPRTNLNDYRRAIDFGQPASRATAVTVAAPVQGGPPTQGNFQQNVTAQSGWGTQLEIWITPWGFLKGAAANNATLRTEGTGGERRHIVTWQAPVKSPGGQPYRLVGYINATTNLVDRVDTWVENPVFGDLQVETSYSTYRDNNGLKFPSVIVQRRGGWPTFEAQILHATANPANIQELLTAPPPPAGGRAGGPGGGGGGQPPAGATSEKLAEGVYRITGGYVALAVEFRDHIFLFEGGPQNEARGLAILAEAKRVIPNKPVRYAAISHHHADHTSGIGALVAEGTAIVMHESNKAYFDRALANPRTLAPDAMAKSGKKPILETVGDRRVFQDPTHTVELHHIKGLPHADSMLIAYLPKERIIAYGDMFNMPAPNAAPPTEPNIAHVVMVDNLERLKLDYDTVISVHAPNPDRPIRKADIYATIPGRVAK